MKIVFYGNRQGGFIDKAIRWWTSSFRDRLNGKWRDSFSHVELLFSDGIMFSASQHEDAARFARYDHGSAWVEVEIDTSEENEAIVRNFCEIHEGAKYDYLGILGFIFGNKDNKGKWFCSEVCTEALKQIGMFSGIDSADISPNRLYNMLKELSNDSGRKK